MATRSFGAGGRASRQDVGAPAYDASFAARRRDRTGGMALVGTKRCSLSRGERRLWSFVDVRRADPRGAERTPIAGR